MRRALLTAAALSADAFGGGGGADFGSFGGAPAAPAPSDFASPPPAFVSPVPTGGVSPPPAALGALGATVTQLVSEERYDEARECELHAEAAAQMEVLKGAYTAAKMDDNLEEAIHIRNQMTQLKDKMQPDAAVAAWQQPAADRTVGAMVAKAKQIFGDAEAAPFAASCATDLRALAASDLAAAAAEQKRARAGLELLLEVPPDAQKRHLANIGRLRAAVAKALTDGVAALEGAAALEPAERDGALRAPRVEALKHELVELRRLGGVLAASQARHAAVFVASAAAATPAVDARAEQARLDAELRRALVVVGGDDDVEPLEVGRHWEEARPMAERCALSLLPLREAEGEMPPTLEWEGKRYHAPCAQAWKHLVEKSALP